MKKIIIGLTTTLLIITQSNAKEEIINKTEKIKNIKKQPAVKLINETNEKMNWINKLEKEEKTKVISIYRVMIETVAQKMNKKAKENPNIKDPLKIYLNTIGISDLIFIEFLNKQEELRKALEEEIKKSREYINDQTTKEDVMNTFMMSNEIKMKIIKEMKKNEFRELMQKYKREIKESLPYIFQDTIKFKLKEL
jgi:hypothetical protein